MGSENMFPQREDSMTDWGSYRVRSVLWRLALPSFSIVAGLEGRRRFDDALSGGYRQCKVGLLKRTPTL